MQCHTAVNLLRFNWKKQTKKFLLKEEVLKFILKEENVERGLEIQQDVWNVNGNRKRFSIPVFETPFMKETFGTARGCISSAEYLFTTYRNALDTTWMSGKRLNYMIYQLVGQTTWLVLSIKFYGVACKLWWCMVSVGINWIHE